MEEQSNNQNEQIPETSKPSKRNWNIGMPLLVIVAIMSVIIVSILHDEHKHKAQTPKLTYCPGVICGNAEAVAYDKCNRVSHVFYNGKWNETNSTQLNVIYSNSTKGMQQLAGPGDLLMFKGTWELHCINIDGKGLVSPNWFDPDCRKEAADWKEK